MRKLKGLGLTVSFPVGYEVSPRGLSLPVQHDTPGLTHPIGQFWAESPDTARGANLRSRACVRSSSRFRSVVGLTLGLTASPAAVAAVDGGGLPVDDYASYEPQTTCSKTPKPGTVALGEYLVATYGGSGGAVNRPCSGSGASEHKDGRAIDWVLDADDPADRRRAKQFLTDAFATDAEGNPHALARRMGIMYVIWSDHFYPAYDQFEQESYLSSSCRIEEEVLQDAPPPRPHAHLAVQRRRPRADQLLRRPAAGGADSLGGAAGVSRHQGRDVSGFPAAVAAHTADTRVLLEPPLPVVKPQGAPQRVVHAVGLRSGSG